MTDHYVTVVVQFDKNEDYQKSSDIRLPADGMVMIGVKGTGAKHR